MTMGIMLPVTTVTMHLELRGKHIHAYVYARVRAYISKPVETPVMWLYVTMLPSSSRSASWQLVAALYLPLIQKSI